MLTARTFAREKGISYTTVMAWLRDGLIPDAAQEETPMGMVWQIPAASLDKIEKRKPGPKSKVEQTDPVASANGQPAIGAAEATAEAAPAPKPAKLMRGATRKARAKKAAKKKAP